MARTAKLKKLTIVDIAERAGVSVSTVSRILNNKPDVAEETRQRVLQVIAEQRFAPHNAWQQLRSGKSRVISLHFPQDFNQACRRYELPILWLTADLKANDVHNAVLRFLAEHPAITALVTPQYAGVPVILKALQARGLQIPADISMIGLMDDSLAEAMTFPLTTINFHSRKLGNEAACLILARLRGELRAAQQILLPAELCVRSSTGPPRPAAR